MIQPRPHFLCIGATKAGTTWFHRMMDLHPGIWMSMLKETHYYDGRFGETVKVPIAAIRNRTINFAKRCADKFGPDAPQVRYWQDLQSDIWTPDWYGRVFDYPDAAGRMCGESTPAYAALPVDGIRAIHDELPDVRIIHFIRDPVPRALSALKMSATMAGFDPQSPPDAAWWLQRLGPPGFLERGNYADQIPRWRSVFPDERLLYVPFGDVRTDPAGLLARIERFLGLPPARYSRKRLARTLNAGADFDIQTEVAHHLQQTLAHQTAFLQETFGEDFCARI